MLLLSNCFISPNPLFLNYKYTTGKSTALQYILHNSFLILSIHIVLSQNCGVFWCVSLVSNSWTMIGLLLSYTQRLWVPTQDLHEIKPVDISVWMEIKSWPLVIFLKNKTGNWKTLRGCDIGGESGGITQMSVEWM